MKVYIDGQECPDFSGFPDARTVLSEAMSQVSKEGRVLTEIRVDGVVVDEEAFSGITGGMQAWFTSQPVHELVRESLEEALKYVPRFTRGLEEIAVHFEGNELALGQGKLADAADGLDWLLSVFHNCVSLLRFADEAENADIVRMKEALTSAVTLLGSLYEEKKFLQMALCIRQRLIPEIADLAVHLHRLCEFACPPLTST